MFLVKVVDKIFVDCIYLVDLSNKCVGTEVFCNNQGTVRNHGPDVQSTIHLIFKEMEINVRPNLI